MTRIEAALSGIPEIETVFANVGLDAGESGTVRSKKENHAEFNVRLHKGLGREAEARTLETIRSRVAAVPEATVTLEPPTIFTFKTPVEVEIYGYDLEALQTVSGEVARVLDGIAGLEDIKSSMVAGNPEVQIRFDRDKLKMAGLGLRESSEALRTHILGRVATDYKERDRQIDIRVRGAGSQEIDFADLNTVVVGYHGELPVQLTAVADVAVSRGPARIHRFGQPEI